MDRWERFDEKPMPDKEAFYSLPNMEEDYPAHFLPAPGLAWQTFLKKQK